MQTVLRANAARARVTNTELFFDLVYVFAVTQVSHVLLAHLDTPGALHALVLWFAVWLGWQYACWFSNWFDPEEPIVRFIIFTTMLVGLVMAVAIPHAFDSLGVLFGASYATMQIGRAAMAVLLLRYEDRALRNNFRRILGWSSIAGALWVAGGFLAPEARLVIWAVAVACEYVSPMVGFWLPGLGRSHTTDWTIDGGHLAERCQLFVIVALGESIVVTGTSVAEAGLAIPSVVGFIVAFVSTAATWWLYFDTGSSAAAAHIEEAEDPGRVGALFHYVHVVLVGAIVVLAVGSDLAIAEPDHRVGWPQALVLVGGPALYLLANGVFKASVFGRFPLSHLAGLCLLASFGALSFRTDNLMIAGLCTSILVVTAIWEHFSRGRATQADAAVA
jgi:low temperature requirement protein LtrA